MCIAGRVLTNHRQTLANGWVLIENSFDLTQFNAEAAQLDLVVDAAQVFNRAVRAIAATVAGTVHPRVRLLRERIGNEAFRRQIIPPVVATRQSVTRQVKFARNSDRNRLTAFFRIILAIPQFVVVIVLGIAAAFVTLIAFFAVLFTGKWPPGMLDFVIKVQRWSLRVQAYTMLLTDLYPPFALD